MNVIYENLLIKIDDQTVLDSEIIQDIECAKCKDFDFDINYVEYGGWSSLMYAVKSERKELVEYILEDPDININLRCSLWGDGTTLHVLCSYTNKIHILKLFLGRRDLDVNIRNKWGWTGLHEACYNNYIEYVKELLLDARVDPSIRNRLGKTAIDYAIKRGHLGIANMLERTGYTPLLRISNEALCRDIVRMIIEEYV